jgi:predicted DNA binding CopG/RHH family protein
MERLPHPLHDHLRAICDLFKSKPLRSEFEKTAASVNMRLPEPLLAAA